MKKGDQLCILRAEVKTDADALNLLRLVAALTAIGIPLDDCPYLETRELIENVERQLVTWTLKAKSICGQHDARNAWRGSANPTKSRSARCMAAGAATSSKRGTIRSGPRRTTSIRSPTSRPPSATRGCLQRKSDGSHPSR